MLGSTTATSAAFATIKDGSGTWFATRNAAGQVAAFVSTAKNDLSTWVAGDHVTDQTTGFTGTLNSLSINSLRFNAAGGSHVQIAAGQTLNIVSGGILVTDQVAAGTPGIFGGILNSSVAELIIAQDSAVPFEISSTILGTNAITKTGVGTLILSGQNFSTGTVQLQAGVLQLKGGNALGDTTVVTLADDQSSTLQLLDDETIGRLAGGSVTTGLDTLAVVDINGQTLTMNQNAASTYAGLFRGAGTIVKNGALFDLTLTNNSSAFTGTLRINEGGILLSGIGAIAATNIEINKGGYLRLVTVARRASVIAFSIRPPLL
ncbi:MAG: autotransporter-associated beta strand repeat-containing protein [Pirellulales bacterium]